MQEMQSICLTVILLMAPLVGGDNPSARSTVSGLQDDSVVTDTEKVQAQTFARQFVTRLLRTRDVKPLVTEFFVRDFTSLSKQDFYEKVTPELYAKLSRAEKVRLFVAQENLGYLITLDVLMQPEQPVSGGPLPFQNILPDSLARKLTKSRLVEGTASFTNRKELIKELLALEKSLLKARPILKRRNLERSATFVKRLGELEKNPKLGYRVRASLIDEDLRRDSAFSRFAEGQKLFSIDTPLLIELIVVNDNGKLRILTLVPADND